MHTKPHLSTQGELFSPPAKLRQLPPEARLKMVRLLARIYASLPIEGATARRTSFQCFASCPCR
jgi:hypothetical protein